MKPGDTFHPKIFGSFRAAVEVAGTFDLRADEPMRITARETDSPVRPSCPPGLTGK